MHLQTFIKIHQLVHKILSINRILSKFIHLFWRYCGKHIFTSFKGHNSVLLSKFSPIAIPNHSSLISMSMQSMKETGQKLLKLESGNGALTDTQTIRRVLHNTPPLCVAGCKNAKNAPKMSKIGNGLIHLIRMDRSAKQIWVKDTCLTFVSKRLKRHYFWQVEYKMFADLGQP